MSSTQIRPARPQMFLLSMKLPLCSGSTGFIRPYIFFCRPFYAILIIHSQHDAFSLCCIMAFEIASFCYSRPSIPNYLEQSPLHFEILLFSVHWKAVFKRYYYICVCGKILLYTLLNGKWVLYQA